MSRWSGRDRKSYSLTRGEIGRDASGVGKWALGSLGDGDFLDAHFSRRIVVDSLATLVFGGLLGGGWDDSMY